MKLKKILRSLMQVNAETADKIMKDYPAGCNADKVFDKSFKKYLSQKSMLSSDGTASFDESESSFTPSVEKRHFNRFFKTGGIVLATTAYIGAFILIMNIADHSPSHDINSPDGLIDQSMITIQSDTNEKDVIPTKEPSTENKEKTTAPATKNSKESTASATNVTTTPKPENHPDYVQNPQDEQVPDITENPTESAQTSEVPAADTTIAAAESTEAVMTTTEPPQTAGYFEIQNGTYNNKGAIWDKIIFVPPEKNVDVHEHSYEINGFTIEQEDPPNHLVLLKDENGTLFPIYTYSYEEFYIGMNPAVERTYQLLEIDGKAVCRELQDTQGALEIIAWDDGCHISFTLTKRENYDKVEFLIRNFN